MNRFLFLILLSVFSLPLPAQAQCANPHAAMGVIIFNKAHKIMQYCNGESWIGLWGGRGNGLTSCADGEIAQFSGGKWACNDGSGIDNINASNLKSGTVPPARLGTGTANNSTFLRGDGTWAAPSSGNNCASGVSLGGACWYLGIAVESCAAVCASFGGYHEATNTYAGYGGSLNNCYNVARAMGLPIAGGFSNANHPSFNWGCAAQWNDGISIGRWVGSATTAAATAAATAGFRLCGCNN